MYSTDSLPLPGSIGRLSLLENGFKPEVQQKARQAACYAERTLCRDVDQCFTVTA